MKNYKFSKKKLFLVVIASVILIGGFSFQGKFRNYFSEIFFLRGNSYFEDKNNYNLTKAKKFYQAAIFLDESCPVAHYQLGRIYFLGGDFEKAISEFDLELEKNPQFSKTYYMRGLTQGYAKNFDEAAADFDEFIAKNPQTWAAYNDLAWVYLLAGDFVKAKEICEKGLLNDQNNPWLRSNLGTALMNLGELAAAEKEFLAAYAVAKDLTAEDWDKVYPGNSPRISEIGNIDFKAGILLNLAIVNKRLGNKEQAEKAYTQYLDILPENDKRKIPLEYFMAIN